MKNSEVFKRGCQNQLVGIRCPARITVFSRFRQSFSDQIACHQTGTSETLILLLYFRTMKTETRLDVSQIERWEIVQPVRVFLEHSRINLVSNFRFG